MAEAAPADPAAAAAPEENAAVEPQGMTEEEKQERNRKQDSLNTEFIYYSSVLKKAAAVLSNDADRVLAIPWIKKLFRPEYQSSKLKEKRNRYLVSLVINLLNDDIYGIFKKNPEDGPLPDLNTVCVEPTPAAEWELDTFWQDMLQGLPPTFTPLKCSVHETVEECKSDMVLEKILDQEFQFFLYLARPYAALLTSSDRTRAAAWLQTLCSIQKKFCSSMKAIRNDYLMTLLGFLQDLRVVGPFLEYPPMDTLMPLAEAVRKQKPVIDPTSTEADEFLRSQPVPDDGAFCYIALTGDLITSSFGPNA